MAFTSFALGALLMSAIDGSPLKYLSGIYTPVETVVVLEALQMSRRIGRLPFLSGLRLSRKKDSLAIIVLCKECASFYQILIRYLLGVKWWLNMTNNKLPISQHLAQSI